LSLNITSFDKIRSPCFFLFTFVKSIPVFWPQTVVTVSWLHEKPQYYG
jgi:hypothetical protein